ncbi:MAG: cyclic nucleotide-binding domain-containing protein [Methylothermaceae bacterium]|nr:cyclic nucleotide-binding domain-containing protein [Methylothermaceae bacterium]
MERAMDALQSFQTVPFFQRLEQEDHRYLADSALERVFAAGDPIIREGEKGEAFYFIRRGRVSVCRTIGKDVIPLVELGQGHFFGENSLAGFEPAPAMATVTAKLPTDTWVITRDAVLNWERQKPAGAARFFRTLSAILSNKLQTLDEAYVRLSLSCEGKERFSELRELQEKLYREWGL